MSKYQALIIVLLFAFAAKAQDTCNQFKLKRMAILLKNHFEKLPILLQ